MLQENLTAVASSESASPLPSDFDNPRSRRINWPVATWLTLIHIGAIFAPFTFTWYGLFLALALHWLTGGIGICLGFHRLLTHGSFRTYPFVKWALAAIGGLAGEGTAIDWVANHRKHHAHSDKPGDPHSPRDGTLWSHMFWLAYVLQGEEKQRHNKRWAPDLAKDPVVRAIGHLFLPIQFAFAGLLFAVGYLVGGMTLAWSFLIWGMAVRLVFVLHATWFVNSATHIWGYKNYDAGDDSKNLWWVAMISYGEGWHNNHHAFPRMANHGHRWWELDPTFWMIRLMKCLGLAWDVVDYQRRGG